MEKLSLQDHGPSVGDATTKAYFDHSQAPRINTDVVFTRALKEQYPELHLIVAPARTFDPLGFAASGQATLTPLKDDSHVPSSLQWKFYVPPARRIDGSAGSLVDMAIFGRYLYSWDGYDFLIYLVDGRDGDDPYPQVKNWYVLTADKLKADALIVTAGAWATELHNEVWVFDGGDWMKSAELWRSANNSTWDAVILDPDMKKALIEDHVSFFESRDTYTKLKVPWKRGIIYHGPPGNGKTISIKATMHMLSDMSPSIPTLYVRSLNSWAGPEWGIKSIFNKAREYAPCYLVLEDLDTIISDDVRSYFLNEVDGLEANDGIFMIGSTNHLERLDPGLSKRPSRFDRKYFFPDPILEQREAYCHFWQRKLKGTPGIEFPDRLCKAIAKITFKFSFAYIQEAFVASLLAIARTKGTSKAEEDEDEEAWSIVSRNGRDIKEGDLDDLVLWVEMKKQVKILREGMDNKD